MSDFQICLCGAAPGYVHDNFCPRPLFRASEKEQRQWESERAELRRAMKQHAAKLAKKEAPHA